MSQDVTRCDKMSQDVTRCHKYLHACLGQTGIDMPAFAGGQLASRSTWQKQNQKIEACQNCVRLIESRLKVRPVNLRCGYVNTGGCLAMPHATPAWHQQKSIISEE